MPMVKTGYRYSVEESDTYEDSYELSMYDWQHHKFDLEDELDLQDLAEACAGDFHSNHDGWEYRSWNEGSSAKEFYIWVNETTKVAFDIQLEYEPTFHAYRSDGK